MINAVPWLSTPQTAHRLGVKTATVYAYVSRGLLHSHRDPVTRTSRFDTREVEHLALRGRPRQSSRSRSLELQIETRITQILGHTIRYRGHDALVLAHAATFEQVAQLLWTGVLPADTTPWVSSRPTAAGRAAVEAADTMTDRLRLIATNVAVGEHPRRDAWTFADGGAHLIATLVDSLPPTGDGRCPRLVLGNGTPVRASIAGRLWARLSPRRATPSMVAVLNATLVLLADHEMAASTLAARVAASTRAGLHDVVAAGMGTLSGPLHGGESRRARRLLHEAADGSVRGAIADALERHQRLPGFGQVLYPDGDPRAALLLGMLAAAGPQPELAALQQVIDEAARQRLPPPNVDLALAALGSMTAMADDAGTAIFTAARVAGWLAHALEEYDEQPLRFRPRAVYIGPTARTG
ncbi:MAG: hypothetical protein RJA49_1954 [Actinomycetota bacterium]